MNTLVLERLARLKILLEEVPPNVGEAHTLICEWEMNQKSADVTTLKEAVAKLPESISRKIILNHIRDGTWIGSTRILANPDTTISQFVERKTISAIENTRGIGKGTANSIVKIIEGFGLRLAED